MQEWLQRIEAEIEERELIPNGEQVLLAISGGLDSMVLLHGISRLADRHRWNPSVAHFNHQLRGRSSDADESFVRRTAEKLGLKFHGGRSDVKTHATKNGVSTEMAARQLRHEFLAGTALKTGAPRVAVGHHADDQVELFLLRLLRGAGSEGLAGMRWRSPSPASPTLEIIRPLLQFTRRELQDIARQEKIPFREDSSNRSHDFLRNRLRHQIVPALEGVSSGFRQNVLNCMEILRAEADFVSQEAQGALKDPSRSKRFNALPTALQRKVIQLQLRQAQLDESFQLIDALRTAAEKWVTVADSTQVRLEAGSLVQRTTSSLTFEAESIEVALDREGEQLFGGQLFEWKRLRMAGTRFQAKAGVEWFDADSVRGPITLRHWRPGDRFQPIGMPEPIKLQDLFVNGKVPPAERRRRVIAVTATGDIFWVQGLRIAERFKLKSATKYRLRWSWRTV